eukprot:Tbor_TRINITY_DN5281_c3_g6::TRINITY_DN5281_c3_g6_i1::g.16503::m.16503
MRRIYQQNLIPRKVNINSSIILGIIFLINIINIINTNIIIIPTVNADVIKPNTPILSVNNNNNNNTNNINKNNVTNISNNNNITNNNNNNKRKKGEPELAAAITFILLGIVLVV